MMATWEDGTAKPGRLDTAVLNAMGRPAISERNAQTDRTERTFQALKALVGTMGVDATLKIAADLIVSRKPLRLIDADKRVAEVTTWVDRLADDSALEDSQYLSARTRALGLAEHLTSQPPMVIAMLAVIEEVQKGA